MCKTIAEMGGRPEALREVAESLDRVPGRIEHMMKPSLWGVRVGRRGSQRARLGSGPSEEKEGSR
jgi:hypothetical protein